MRLTDEERRTVVNLELEKARQIYAQIDGLKQLGFWDNIANRLYYALFHAVTALLIYHGFNVNTHRGAVASFGLNFIKTGIFDIEDGKLLSQLQTMREKSDYNCAFETSQEDVLPMIAPCHRLITKISQYIGNCD